MGYFLKADFKYSEQLHKTRNDLPFLQKRVEIVKLQKFV